MTNQTMADWAQDYSYGQGTPANPASQPTWEAYYNYAQQLYTAGYREQAEAYYRQAQQLYQQESRQTNPPATYAATNSTQQLYQQESRQTNPPATYPVGSARESAPIDFSVSLKVDPWDDLPETPTKRPWKKRLKFWGGVSLVLLLLGSVSGYIGLLFHYRQQLRAGTVGSASDGTIAGDLGEIVVNPMVEAMRPSLDKTLRLAAAAQPLLYELNILPEELYSRIEPRTKDVSPSTAIGEAAETAEFAESSEPTTAEPTTGETATAEASEASENTGTSPTADSVATADAPSDGSPVDIETGEAASEVASKSASSSRSKRRRSDSHRDRSSSKEAAWQESNDIEEIEPDEPERRAAPVEEPLIDTPRSNSKTQALDDLLAAKPRKAPSAAEKPAAPVKASLSRAEVQQGMARVAPTVKRCGQGQRGTVSIAIKIGQNGRIASASATGAYAGTSVGRCAEQAVRRAVFPASQKSLTVKYPFTL